MRQDAAILRLDMMAGSTITDACFDAQRTANMLLIAVIFSFNGVELMAHRKTTSEYLVDEYWRALKRESEQRKAQEA